MRWVIFIVGLAALMAFNAKVMGPLFGTDTGGMIGAVLWAVMTGGLYGVYGLSYILRRD